MPLEEEEEKGKKREREREWETTGLCSCQSCRFQAEIQQIIHLEGKVQWGCPQGGSINPVHLFRVWGSDPGGNRSEDPKQKRSVCRRQEASREQEAENQPLWETEASHRGACQQPHSLPRSSPLPPAKNKIQGPAASWHFTHIAAMQQ